ncbi:uncharacterized membrane protein HdeD (DUF308 family) [Azomonas macrocytogenes]|uniref:Uncharacterized membrane protein HdeD (DUF308 family) n=1 Tax=Azomonas macrocytogenes TaxID=69962 RepID=A0A839T5F1_AZOMA|nr:uncharacterized membrane protein HdeD (DUF308 family) [Azomonas macrocytogenes]
MGNGERSFAAIFGLLLLGTGLYALFSDQTGAAWRYIGGISLVVIGANAIYGALTRKRPWISKIGPLP